MADETRTADELAQDYFAMGHSVDLINGIIDGSRMADETQEEKNDCVDRNVRHLEIMVAKEDWGSEDMTPSNDAITAGKAYIA
tara:strand:- start:159 stop:407 length:249 start_codon:yes stop_codon:yes gene_type:complete